MRRLVREVLRLAGREGAPAVTVVLTGDEEVHRLNREFRGKDRPTDVLSFPAGDDLPEGEEELGGIVISVETAAKQARARRRPVEHEVRILLIHGVLHLLGFDHETDDGEMEALERRIRRALLAPSPARGGRR